MPELTVAAGPDAGKRFELTGDTLALGRHSSNAVHLADQRVSRRHLELRATPGGYRLHDLSSGNGTLVNGEAVEVIDLRPGDRVQVGDTLLIYSAGQPEADHTRLIVRPVDAAAGQLSATRTVAADRGSQLLRRPDLAPTDWLRGRLASLAALYEAASAVSQILDVDEMLGRIVDLALRTAEADRGCALLSDPESGELKPRAVRARLGGPAGAEFVVSRTIVDHVLTTGQGVLVADAAGDARFGGRESVVRHRLREVICVPMKGRHGTVGALFLDTEGQTAAGRFSEDHLALAVALAHQAALAVEETRHYQALVQAERLAAVGQTMAALSHHVKNIMQGVRFGGDLVRLGLGDGDLGLVGKGWKLVERNQGRIDDLILDMLSYAKGREPALERCDLNGVAADVAELARGRAEAAGVELRFEPGELPPVECDPEGIHRALLNIVGNAVDAAEGQEPARVTLGSRLDGDFAELVVTDTGPGVPPERVAELFKPFVSTKGSRGTGLGLPVSRKILQEHGGDVSVSNAPAGGAVFTLRLPVVGPGVAAT